MLIDGSRRRGCRTLLTALLATLISCAAPATLHAQALFDRFNMAVAADRTDEVAALLARGMDPNTVDLNGDPALLVAARLGYEATLDVLLRVGAKVNARNRFGDSAILVAAIGGQLAIVKKLVARGAAINADGWTPLIYAATGGRDEVVRRQRGERQPPGRERCLSIEVGATRRIRQYRKGTARARRSGVDLCPRRCYEVTADSSGQDFLR